MTTVETVDVRERSSEPITKEQFEAIEGSESFWRLVDLGIVSLARSRETPFGIRASNYVGDALILPTLRLRISEKISGALYALLQTSVPDDLKIADAASPIANDGTILRTFASKYIEALGAYFIKGRLKRYVPTFEIATVPRGRLNRAGTLRLRSRGVRDRLAQNRFLLSGDLLENQLLAAALHEAEILLRNDDTFSEQLTTARLYAPLLNDADILSVQRQSLTSKIRLFERSLAISQVFPELRRALLYARLLVLHSGIWVPVVEQSAPEAYFLNLETLFEEAVRVTMSKILTTGDVQVTKGSLLNAPLFVTLPDRYVVDPDIVVHVSHKPTIVADCKYKELERLPSHSDVYQLLSHCSSIKADIGILFYPGLSFSCFEVGKTGLGIGMWCCTLRPTRIYEDLIRCLGAFKLSGYLSAA